MNYPPIQNGMDYLRSVVGHLDHEEPGPRDLKYAVLHLQAATEVLLKARLVSIDWRLVFMKPDEAAEVAYKQGDFNSCKVDDAIKRLRAEGVQISPEAKGHITNLGQQRNRLQHFGLTATGPAVEARAAQVLHFLIGFVDEYLRPGLDGADAQHLEEEMRVVREALPRIREYARTRMEQLAPALDPLKGCTLRCPDCGMWALIADGGSLECRFCPQEWDPDTFPLAYAVWVLGHSFREYRKTGQPAKYCPECGAYTLMHEVYLADDPDRQREFCFSCSEVFDGLEDCLRCTMPFQPNGDDDLACGDCWSSAMAKD